MLSRGVLETRQNEGKDVRVARVFDRCQLAQEGIAASSPREARHGKAAMGTMPNKTDRSDVRGVAQLIRTDWY